MVKDVDQQDQRAEQSAPLDFTEEQVRAARAGQGKEMFTQARRTEKGAQSKARRTSTGTAES